MSSAPVLEVTELEQMSPPALEVTEQEQEQEPSPVLWPTFDLQRRYDCTSLLASTFTGKEDPLQIPTETLEALSAIVHRIRIEPTKNLLCTDCCSYRCTCDPAYAEVRAEYQKYADLLFFLQFARQVLATTDLSEYKALHFTCIPTNFHWFRNDRGLNELYPDLIERVMAHHETMRQRICQTT
jgi:hypothetical protein